MKRFVFPTALLVVACLLLGPLLECAPVLRARSAHEALCGDHDCGCDGSAPVSAATCCCAGALRREPATPAPPPGVDADRWRLAWGDAPACRPVTLHDLPETRWVPSPCGVDLEPEGTRVASSTLAPLPAATWLPRAGSRRRRVVEARVVAVRRPRELAQVPILLG